MDERDERPVWLRYGMAILFVALASAITANMHAWFAPTPLAMFFAAVAFSAWYSGLGPALLAIVLSLPALAVWVLPGDGLRTVSWSDVEVLATFLLVSGLVSGLSASRDRAEAALRVGERRFRTMLESANEGVWQIDRDAHTQYANDRMAALLGATREQVAAGTVPDFVFAEDLPAARQRIGANLSGHAEVFDFRFRRADGEEVLVLAGTSPVRDRAGKITGALGFYSDVTERRRAEAALARANERFALASDAVQSLIYEWDLATNRVERTAGLQPLLGYRPDEAPETLDWWNERIHPEDRPRIVEESTRLDWEDDRYSRQYRMQHRDGHWITVWDQGRVVRDRHGRVLRVIGSTVDITARTEAEEALRFLAEAGRALASSLDFEETLQRVAWLTVPRFADWCVVDLVDEQGNTHRAAIAYADPEAAGTAASLMHFAPTGGGDGPEEQALRTGTPLVVEHVDDELARESAHNAEHLSLLRGQGILSLIVMPLQYGGAVHGIMSLATSAVSGRRFDADDVELAEQLARRAAVAIENARLFRDAQSSEARYRGLFEGTKDGIIVFAPDGTCVDVNAAMMAMVDYDRDELIGAQATLVACGGPWFGEEREQLRHSGQWRGEFSLRRKSGTLLSVESWIATVELPTGPGYVGVLRDVSERKHFEQVQEEFLSALAHDLKNPLTTVRGQTQLLLRRLQRGEPPDSERLTTSLEGVDSAAARMARLIDELSDVMRLRAGQEIELQRKAIDLVALARQAIEEHSRVTERHTIHLESDAAELIGIWDGPRLERVLANLLGNAVKYSPAGGEIIVRIARVGDAALLSVADHGVGIPTADLGLIFERFRRAGNVERFAGSGIGLAGAKRIVELHGGTISVASAEGVGSTFTVRLPIVAPETVALTMDEPAQVGTSSLRP